MSDVADPHEPFEESAARAQPARRSRGPVIAVGALVLVALLAGLAWWSGAVQARVDVTVESHEFFAQSGQGEVVAQVQNLGLVPTDARAVYIQPDRGWVRELSTDQVRLGPREAAELVVVYRVDCELWDGTQRRDPIGIEASATVGRAQSTAIPLDDAIAWCESEDASAPIESTTDQ